MANNRYRIEIPSNPAEIIGLLGAIKAKHDSLGAASPLGGLKWSEIGTSLSVAGEQHELSVKLHREAEAATGARDAKIPVLTEAIRSARDVLMGLNRDNPDALGDYGFDVADSRSSDGKAPVSIPA